MGDKKEITLDMKQIWWTIGPTNMIRNLNNTYTLCKYLGLIFMPNGLNIETCGHVVLHNYPFMSGLWNLPDDRATYFIWWLVI